MMPWWRLLVAVVALLLLPLVSTQDSPTTLSPPTPPPEIDLNNTVKGDAYFFRKSCVTKKSNEDTVLTLMSDIISTLQCDVILRMRKRGDKKLLVDIDIQHIPWITTSAKLDPIKSITIEQGPFSIECKPDGEVKAVCTNDLECKDSGLKDISIDRKFIKPVTYFTEGRISCSFLMQSPTPTLASKFAQFPHEPKLKFNAQISTSTPMALTYAEKYGVLWDKATPQCDPDLVSTSDEITEESGFSLTPVDDVTAKKLNCTIGRLYITSENENDVTVDSIECGPAWWYTIGLKSTVLNEKFIATCKIKYCAQCKPLTPLECPSCDLPPTPEMIGDECPKITCPHNRWFLEGDGLEKWVDNPKIECDRIINGSTPYYAWMMDGIEVKKGACTKDYDCLIHSAPILDCISLDTPCQIPTVTPNGTISCDAIGFRLKFGQEINAKSLSADRITCQHSTGLFFNGIDTVPPGETIGCYMTREHRAAALDGRPSSASIDNVYLIVIAVVFVLILLIGIPIAIFFWMKRRSPEAPPVVVTPVKNQRKERKTTGALLRRGTTFKAQMDARSKGKNNSSSSSGTSLSIAKSDSKTTKNSTKSTHSNQSKKKNKWPKGFRRRKFNRDRPFLNFDTCDITPNNAYPCPRFASKCPDEYSTSMEIQNPRLVELQSREKPTTVSQSIQKQAGEGKGPPTSQSLDDKKTPKSS